MKKHAPKEGEPRWPCCGVPLADAAERGVPAGGHAVRLQRHAVRGRMREAV